MEKDEAAKTADTKPLEPATTNGASAHIESKALETKAPEAKSIEPKAPAPKAPEPTGQQNKAPENKAPVNKAPVEDTKEASRPQPPAKKKSLAALVKETADKPVVEKKRYNGVYSKADLLRYVTYPYTHEYICCLTHNLQPERITTLLDSAFRFAGTVNCRARRTTQRPRQPPRGQSTWRSPRQSKGWRPVGTGRCSTATTKLARWQQWWI